MNKFLRIAIRTIMWGAAGILILLLTLIFLIRIPKVQNYVVGKATHYLEQKLNTTVEIGYVNISFPKNIVLEDVYIEDLEQNPLIDGKRLFLDISMFKLLKNTVEIQEIKLEGIRSVIKRNQEGVFNFDFIVDAFSDGESDDDKDDDSPPMKINIGKVKFDDIHFLYDDQTIGLHTELSLDALRTRIKKFDLEENMAFSLPDIKIQGLQATIKQWPPLLTDSTTTADTANTETEELLPDIELGKIDLSNIEIAYQDEESALESIFNLGKLQTSIKEIDLNKEWVNIESILLDNTQGKVAFGKKEQNPEQKEPDQTDSLASEMNWKVASKKTIIKNTQVAYADENEEAMEGFDYFNIQMADVNGDLRDFYFSMDSISGSLQNLSATDHSGFTLKQLKTDFEYTSTGAKLKNLLAETPGTRIQDLIEISYPSLDIIEDHPEQIALKANLHKSQIDMKDIYLFAPFLDTVEVMEPLLDKKFYIDGTINGRMDDLQIPKFDFSTLDNTVLSATAHIKGLPDVDNMYIDLALKKLTTGQKDLNRLIAPSMLPDSIQLPESIYAKGAFKGGMQGFDTDLSLKTDKGNAALTGNMDMAGSDTSYSADIAVSDFDLGHILNQDSLIGEIAFHVDVKGTGLDPKNMQAELKGAFDKIEAMDYPYQDISFQLSANKGLINGTVNSPDPNIQFDLNLDADMSPKYPKAKIDLLVDSVNLQNLKLMDEDFRYHGRMMADIETADIDYLNGTVNILNSSIAYNANRFVLDTISLVATADSNRNQLLFDSEPLKAQMAGNYKLSQLNAAIEDIVQVYYNPYHHTNDTLHYDPQSFEFSATLVHSPIIKEFVPELERLDPVSLDGSFSSEDQTLMAKLIAPKIIYEDMHFDKIGLDLITVDSTMYYSGLLESIQINDIELKNTTISGDVYDNNLSFGAWIKDKDDNDQYHLGANLLAENETYTLKLKEDGFMLNYDLWNIDPNNILTFGKEDIKAENFTLSYNNQSLSILSQDSAKFAPIDLNFDNFRIETLSKIIESEDFQLGGGINGAATLSELNNDPVFVSDITVDKFFFGKDTIGNIDIMVNNETQNEYNADVKIYGNDNDVRLAGKFLVSENNPLEMDANLTLEPLTVKTLEAFSFGNLQKSEGNIRGALKISGNVDKPSIEGELNFDKARLNATMLNSDLRIDQQKIVFNKKGINFQNFEIKDARQNSTKISGRVMTEDYMDYAFNLNVNANDFEAVNSTREDNDLFFGKLYISTNLRITGDMDKPVVDGNLKVNERTDMAFAVPDENPGEIDREGVVKFVNKRDTLAENVFARLDSMSQVEKLSGIDLTLTLQTDPQAKFQIILDEGSDEALHIQGTAELNAGIDASDKITMSGTYTVEDGHYALTFGPVTRAFSFQKGSSITWNGDPFDAQMNITAVYNEKFPTLELVQNQVSGEASNLYKQRIPFDVKLILSGELFQPDINFDIELDEDQAIVSQDVTSKVNIALSSMREDPAELNKQVFSLIVLGRFMSANPFESLSGGGGAESMARNTVTSLLSSQLNALASNLITGVELDFDLQSEEDYLTGDGQSRTDLSVGMSKMMFDDRLKVTVGSNFEVEGGSRPGEKTNNIAGDISLDYQLSKDGRYFARVYRKNQYQATLQGQFVETGIGFIINMDYNHFKELFMSSRALQNYYNTDSRSFRRRFDVERMETDSVYRDSVRKVLRDSLRNNPRYQRRMKRQKEKEKSEIDASDKDSTKSKDKNEQQKLSSITKNIRNEEDYTFQHEN